MGYRLGMAAAINPHLIVTSETTLDEIEAARPTTGPLLLAMDAAWTPSWRQGDVTVLRGHRGVTIFVWEPRGFNGPHGGGEPLPIAA